MKTSSSAFTLIELVVVITILAILGTIGFVSLSGYSVDARDSVRSTDMNAIYSQMNLSLGTEGVLPAPEDARTIQMNATTIAYQGYAKKKVLSTVKFDKGGRDPKDDTYYTYTTDTKKKQAQLMGYFEEYDTTKLTLLPRTQTTFAATIDYAQRKVGVIGKPIGTLVESGTLVPVQETTTSTALDIGTTTTPYIAYFNSTTTGSGIHDVLAPVFQAKSSIYASTQTGTPPVCGPYHGQSTCLSGWPGSSTDRCTSGTPSTTNYINGKQEWTCTDSTSGTSVSCWYEPLCA